VSGAPAELPQAKGERIAKILARAGLCSRRDAERWIAEGRVSVDGKVLDSPAVTVTEASDVRVDGKPIPQPERARLWRYHKPAGLVTTHRDEKGRPTIFESLPADLPRVISIGRLDLTSEGLLLLTNDGELARRLELPSTGWVRRYKVRVHGEVDPERLAALARGVTVDGVSYGPIRAEMDRQQGSNAWLTVALREGKNREIRRVLEHLGYSVTRLIRLAYGPFQLGALPRGEVEEVPKKVLADQLGTGGATSGAGGDGNNKARPKKKPARAKASARAGTGAAAPASARSAASDAPRPARPASRSKPGPAGTAPAKPGSRSARPPSAGAAATRTAGERPARSPAAAASPRGPRPPRRDADRRR
jgi:23S rRNA pseudouridine2605 synthase